MQTLRSRHLAGAAVVVAAGAACASASIVTFSGAVQQITPPSFVQLGVDYASSADTATIWDEQQGASILNLGWSMVNNPGTSAAQLPGTISGVVDSHYLHYRHTHGTPITGQIVFDAPIVGVSWETALLIASDAALAPTGTTYEQPGIPVRGMNPAIDLIAINGNVLDFQITGDITVADTVEFRVITQVPAPGALALVGAGGLLAIRRRR